VKYSNIVWVCVTLCCIAFALCTLFPDREDSDPDWEWNMRTVLELARKGYTQMDSHRKPVATLDEPGVSTVISGAGIVSRSPEAGQWPDTLDVSVSVVEYGGEHFISVTVDSIPVDWIEPVRIDWPEHRPSPVSVMAEYAIGPEQPFGAGAAWEPVTAWGLRGGVCGTVAIDGSWAAASVRIGHRWGPLSAGADVGYRFGDMPGLHAGLSAGLAVDLH